MSNRDELTELLRDNAPYIGWATADVITDKILAAGYRKPRTITTIEELDALPHHTMIHAADGDHAEHVYDQWFIPGVNNAWHSRHIALPAVVLWEPSA